MLRLKSQPAAETASLGDVSQQGVSGGGGDFSSEKVFSGKLVWSLIWEQKLNLALGALAAVYCTASNLAAPVFSGFLIEILVNGGGVEEYSKVG